MHGIDIIGTLGSGGRAGGANHEQLCDALEMNEEEHHSGGEVYEAWHPPMEQIT